MYISPELKSQFTCISKQHSTVEVSNIDVEDELHLQRAGQVLQMLGPEHAVLHAPQLLLVLLGLVHQPRRRAAEIEVAYHVVVL